MMYTSSNSRPSCVPPNITARCWFTAVNVKPSHGGGLGPVVGGEDHLPAEGEAVQCLLSFLDGSLLYFLCYSESIYLVTHSLRLLLTKLAAFSLYNLDSNGLGILITLMLTFQKPSVQYRSTSVHLDIECTASS